MVFIQGLLQWIPFLGWGGKGISIFCIYTHTYARTHTPNPSSCTMALVSTQLVTEMSTTNLPGGKGWPVRKADSSTAICDFAENVGSLTSHNPMGLHGLLQG
jgi:hypothetical protein